ncbi:putative ferric-chelate reductase 1 [Pyxicephalus adspersus]|uniref:putative ferric-chelate reductase 1 n=1 Tax=Pyxicephalus adspersus TaxID=30357 RepID=UPI003B593781
MILSGFGYIILGMLTTRVASFRSGLVTPACNTMMPNHRGAVPNTTEPPYSVSASNYSYSPGDQITVFLEAKNGSVFKGFLLQAQSVPGNESVGHFIVTDPNSQTINCGSNVNSSLSHINSNNKSYISALWVAPASYANVLFRATFVQTYSNFWVGVESPILTNIDIPIISSTPTVPNNTTGTITSTLTSASSIIPPTHISQDTCGTQKTCFSNPSNCNPSNTSSCYFMSSAKINNGGYQFEISGPASGYVAFGFSDDQRMGNDDIYICGINAAGQVHIQHAYSEGKTRPKILPLTNVEASLMAYSSGVIQCVFSSTNQISTQQPVQQSRSSNSSDLYYVLIAYGSSSNGEIEYHGPSIIISEKKVNLSAVSNVTVTEHEVSSMIKAHGALMLIAWMTTGSIGMVFARFFKVAAYKLVFGKAAWFQGHVALMVLTVAATIVAFILPFIHAKGWSHNAITHATIGCIVMGLAFIQPFIAFFRPSPESSKRIIFNWFHFINAAVIKILAVANLFLGLQFIDHKTGWMVNVMGGFVGWGILSLIAFEINAYLTQKGEDHDKDRILPWLVCGSSRTFNTSFS